jgi:two-component system sensor histidine kinase KdpD
MPSNNFPRLFKVILSVVSAYLFSLIVTGFATLVFFLLRDAVNPAIVALLYLLPVSLSTVVWGLGPGITAAFFAFLAFNYFFIQPYYSLLVHQTQDLLALLVFLTVAVGISQMVGQTRKSLAAATAREREAIRLYELSTVLAGLHDDRAIVQALAQQIKETFQPERVDVILEAKSSVPPVYYRLPAGNSSRAAKPDVLVPIQTVRGLLGEVRLWRKDSPFLPEEERLLRTFASQAVLALERARLAQAESRARLLEESDKLKSSLLSSVSHELRTPLATIKASVTSLRDHTVPWATEARDDLLAAIEEETDHLNQLVGNLLNMTRIEAGALKPQRSWNSLSEIVAGVLNRIRPQRHPVEIRFPEELALVPVDYALMEQVFANLISNSLKYSPENTPVIIQARDLDEDNLLVQVINQGPPVPVEHLERIFDKFNRVTSADRITGTGLGLSICKGIVEAHGGRIWAENLPNGLAFNFTIPLTWEGRPGDARRPKIPVEESTKS